MVPFFFFLLSLIIFGYQTNAHNTFNDGNYTKTFIPQRRRVDQVGNAIMGSNVPLTILRQLYLPKQRNPKYFINAAVRHLEPFQRERILVTGGAGFVGSHLVDRLMLMGHQVIVLDNFYTGNKSNIQHWIGHPHFNLITHDVEDPIQLQVTQVYHLASPASPPHYQADPLKTIKTNMMGTMHMLELAQHSNARFLLASTSEIYGDPEEHPQKETYWGNVNPIGPRACYDEGKRISETLAYTFMHQYHVDVRVARIFNTFGPRMSPTDGRVVSNFIMQSLKGGPLTIYGDGQQTRSFQYIHDLVDGLILLMNNNYTEPVNLGNTEEYTIKEFAYMVRDQISSSSPSSPSSSLSNSKDIAIKYMPAVTDDPHKRKPDITRAKQHLGWEPRFSVKQGLEETVDWFKAHVIIG